MSMLICIEAVQPKSGFSGAPPGQARFRGEGFAALIKDRRGDIRTKPHPAGIRHQCAAEQVEQPRLAGAAEGRRLVG
jgi:hypothetical protein